MNCEWCGETVSLGDYTLEPIMVAEEDENGQLRARQGYRHRECAMRAVLGSVAHQSGLCSCFGKKEPEEKGTRRQAALAAAALFQERSRIR